MLQKLQDIGLSEKESQVYLKLVQIGNSPASTIAKQLEYPRPTVLFILRKLVKKGYISKRYKGNTQYFHADLEVLQSGIQRESEFRNHTLQSLLPELQKSQNNHSHKSRIQFYEGREECQKLYENLLSCNGQIQEFASHDNLADALGEKFMENFIQKRIQKGIHMDVVANDTDTHKKYHKHNSQHLRTIHMIPDSQGKISSAIDIFDEKVIILNLTGDISGIQIDDPSLAQTLGALHKICKSQN